MKTLLAFLLIIISNSIYCQDKIYWADRFDYSISRSNLDGSEIEELITNGINTPTGIDLLVGINTVTNEKEKKIKVGINPNPNNGNFTINSEKKIQRITVYGIDGKFLFEEQGRFYKLDIKMLTYPKGIYFLKIDFEKGMSISKRIIIQ